MKAVAVVPGWAEGPWQAKKLTRLLKASDFLVVKDISEADIIIAHSEACYWLPQDMKAQLVLLVGLPLWPGRSVVTSAIFTQAQGYRHGFREKYLWWWTVKLLFNGWYILSRPLKTYKLLTRHRASCLPGASAQRRVILLRNRSDLFCSPEIMKYLPKNKLKGWRLKELPGHHDSIWLNPQPYIDLLVKAI